MYVCMYINIHIHTHTYIYIHLCEARSWGARSWLTSICSVWGCTIHLVCFVEVRIEIRSATDTSSLHHGIGSWNFFFHQKPLWSPIFNAKNPWSRGSRRSLKPIQWSDEGGHLDHRAGAEGGNEKLPKGTTKGRYFAMFDVGSDIFRHVYFLSLKMDRLTGCLGHGIWSICSSPFEDFLASKNRFYDHQRLWYIPRW